MAYIKREEDEAVKTPGMDVLSPEAATQPVPPTEGEVIPADKISGAPGAEIAPTSVSPVSTAKSGRFVNVQKYIEANRPQIQALAKKMQENVEKSKQAIAESSVKQKEQLQARITPEQQRLAGAQDIVQQQIAEAGTRQFTPEELQRFTALREGTGQFQEISAPDLTEQRLKARALEQLGQRITEGGGREQLLRETIASPKYTMGQRKLDEMLLSSDPTIRKQALENIRRTTTGVERGVTEQEKAARAALGGVRAEASKVSKLAQEQLGTARTGLEEALAARQVEEQAKLPGLIQTATSNIQGVPVWARTSENLQLTPPELNVSKIATPEQLARAKALAQLGGYEQTIIPEEKLVGTYQGDINAAIQQYQQNVKNQYETFKQDTASMMKASPGENQEIMNKFDASELAQLKPENLISMAQSPNAEDQIMAMKLYKAITGISVANPGQVTYRLSLPNHLAVVFNPALSSLQSNIQGLAQTYGYGTITPGPGQVGTETGTPLTDYGVIR